MLFNNVLSRYFLQILFSLESSPDNKEISHKPVGKTNEDIENNNEPIGGYAHVKTETAVEVDEIAGADNSSLVYADVIQLLEAMLDRLEE